MRNHGVGWHRKNALESRCTRLASNGVIDLKADLEDLAQHELLTYQQVCKHRAESVGSCQDYDSNCRLVCRPSLHCQELLQAAKTLILWHYHHHTHGVNGRYVYIPSRLHGPFLLRNAYSRSVERHFSKGSSSQMRIKASDPSPHLRKE